MNRSLVVAAIVCLLAAWSPTANADWAACQSKPTRACLLEEALRGDSGELAGKDRLDFLLLTDYQNHPEYINPADIEEAIRQVKTATSGQSVNPYPFLFLAIKGLVVASRIQEAFDLVSNLNSGVRKGPGAVALTRDLAKAGEFDKLLASNQELSSISGQAAVTSTAVLALTEMGKIQQALAFMDRNPLSGGQDADILVDVGAAYAEQGDPQMAARFYDRAQATLENGGPPSGAEAGHALEVRFMDISLMALRGDAEGVRAALLKLPPVPDNQADPLVATHVKVYGRLTWALLKANQFQLALDVAKAAPKPIRIYSLYTVAVRDAEQGRLDDARVIMDLLGDTTGPTFGAKLLGALATATAKSGDVKSAVALATRANDPVGRRAILFEIAQTLPQ